MQGMLSFEFAGYVLDLRRGRLRKGGVDVALRRKSFSLLAYLVQNSGRVLGKDELVAAVWPDVTVSDDSIAQCMKDIRKALGPDGDRLVRTVPRRGYVVDEVKACSYEDEPLIHASSNTASLPDKPSIAVLPFLNMSGTPGQAHFVDGIVEEIITALSQINWLFVIARNSTFTYKNRDVDVKQIGRELGVRYVLEGSVRKAAELVRISAQLVDTSTGSNIWADRFDGDTSKIFDRQDQIAASVAGAITPWLERAEMERSRRKPLAGLVANDYYLRGISEIHKFEREANACALSNLYRAIELDPEFAPAYGQAARCYAQRRGSGWVTQREQDVAETTRLARRAVELGKYDAVALCTAGFGLADVADQVEDGDAYLDRALALNPNLAIAWLFSGCVKVSLGEPEAAIPRLLHAMQLSPQDYHMSSMQAAMASAHFIAGRYEDANSWAQLAVRGRPVGQLFVSTIAAASGALAGRHIESQRTMQHLREATPQLRLSNLEGVVSYYRPKDIATLSDGLRMAGLPD